jgi:hypothetical protein
MSLPEPTLEKLDWIILFNFPDILTETAVDPNIIHCFIKATGNWVTLQCM